MNLAKHYPCPKCGQQSLVYDGMLVWRSGPRPPRKMARKEVGFSPRADYERERLYHCQQCGTEFYEDMEQRRHVHLYEEGVSGRHTYDGVRKSWQFAAYGRGGRGKGRKGSGKRINRA
jgi:predicted RNA-binding Zn-ribbon protein involved in translation (DUF1610 family)